MQTIEHYCLAVLTLICIFLQLYITLILVGDGNNTDPQSVDYLKMKYNAEV